MRVARAFRLPIIAAAAALLLSGCMHASAPVAQSQSDLDAFAYGDPQIADPKVADPQVADSQVADPHVVPRPLAANATGGAIGALRNALAAAPRNEQPSPAPVAYSAAPVPEPVRYDTGYRLDAGDKLRVVIYGQEGLTNTYAIDAGGAITMPLIGQVPARGRTPATLAVDIAAKLRRGYIREPSVAVEVETYRPFFILGEVAAPGQYSYVPNMTVESAIAIAGGFSPRAKRDTVTLTHTDASAAARYVVPLGTALSPGDTVLVGERWF